MIEAGECYRCKHGALLYPAKTKEGKLVGLCYECRELIKKIQSRHKAGKLND